MLFLLFFIIAFMEEVRRAVFITFGIFCSILCLSQGYFGLGVGTSCLPCVGGKSAVSSVPVCYQLVPGCGMKPLQWVQASKAKIKGRIQVAVKAKPLSPSNHLIFSSEHHCISLQIIALKQLHCSIAETLCLSTSHEQSSTTSPLF